MAFEAGQENETIEADEWSIRSKYWLAKNEAGLSKRKRRERRKDPLILVGYGLSMKVDNGRLIIQDGATHFPSKPAQHVFFKGSLDLPPRIIVLDGAGSITLDALDWLTEQNVPLIRIRYNGEFFSLVTSGGQAADPDKFAWQIRAREDDAEKLTFYLPLMRDKLANALATLDGYLPASEARDKAEEKIGSYLHRLQNDPPDKLKSLLGIEAQSASLYFAAWRALEINWRESKRHPIPVEWRSFYSRGSLAVLNKGGANIFATHPVNAMLNYVYAVLLGRMQLQAITEGYDPMLGVVHTRRRSSYGPPRPGYAIDIMEPHRPVVDRIVLKLINEETFSGADFDLQSDGVVRVNPEFARSLA
ncbi:CRISPR-associated endonuclease Cas1 [Henriciella sp.]|uniref:CRISPR-associated endonuclease Cas1 n=1 Tax=Henriciella sp. TaxID=1968823 RepID=UPI00260AD727|nr:CRISPR-associated endonuclease Cas1 [Henriciella sp.]